jgi:polysaccharide biosynthesis transport protein
MREGYYDDRPDAAEGSNLFALVPRILWERKWLVIVPLVICSVSALAVAVLMEPTYEAEATMLVESQDLPSAAQQIEFDEIDRRMARIREQILSRPDLVELIQTYDLYEASEKKEPLSAVVDRVRQNTTITAVDGGITSSPRGRSSSIAFTLTFSYPEPRATQLVAQTFVNKLLRLDATETQESAENNVNLLENQESRLREELAAVEGQINQISGANGLALSSGGGMMTFGGSGNYDSQIADLQRENAQLRTQLGSGAIAKDPSVVAAEAQLAAAKARYTDTHPDVRLAEQRLAAAKSAASSTQASGVSSYVTQQIEANRAAIAQLQAAKNAEQSRAAQMAAAQARGPAVAQQLTQLQARADMLRNNLGRISSDLLGAKAAETVAVDQRGQRLSLIDPPVTPDRPSKPNRPLLAAAGILGGLALGLVMALLVEFLVRPVRGVAELKRITGAPPLSVVPVLHAQPLGRGWRRWFARAPKEAKA